MVKKGNMTDIPWTPTSDDFDELWEVNELEPPINVPDMLETMFAQQLQHMRVYDELQHTTPKLDVNLYGDIDNPLVQAKIREHAAYTVEELYEAIGILKNKPWKHTMRELTPEQHASFKEELADAWHFFIELHIIAGMSPFEVFTSYFAKTLINKQRQTDNY